MKNRKAIIPAGAKVIDNEPFTKQIQSSIEEEV